MKLSKEKPQNWSRIEKEFGVRWGNELVVTYGDTVHCSKELSQDVLIHETVHSRRQKDPAHWWESYFKDSKFRFWEELLAYRAQYQFLTATIKNRDILARHLFNLSRDLSRMYKLPINQQEAIKLIKMK